MVDNSQMQVPSHRNGAPRAMNVQSKLRAAGQRSTHPTAGKPGQAIVRRDQVDIRGQTDSVSGSREGMTPRERLDAYAQRFLDRLDNLMQKDGLSEKQVDALQQAKTEFERNIERFNDAFLEGGRPRNKIGPALRDIVGALRSSVKEALGR